MLYQGLVTEGVANDHDISLEEAVCEDKASIMSVEEGVARDEAST